MFFSGIVFGLSHGITPSIDMIFYCGMGWILSFLYYYTNNIAYPIGLHLVVNNL
ncbi:CPBP family intramembrane glutamic endopeptidase [Enterococcus durans]|uniref:CPBP family intramembrane glutamic endopeptidase n=1 Tax=Enterococcus durans TaxID=53345 RepID=UPI0039A705A6